jgi:hypothetical protein
MLSNVLFPEPLGPTIATRSPAPSEKDTPRKTTSGSAGVE